MEPKYALVYDALKADARRLVRRGNQAHSPTSLVHETWIRLEAREQHFESETHFRALAAAVMRSIMVDWARAEGAKKRGGGWHQVSLQGLSEDADDVIGVLAIDEALRELAALSERQARAAVLRLFGGLTIDECASELETSRRTVEREWRMARAWLRRRLST